MSIQAALLLLQASATTGVVPERTAELDTAHACLVTSTDSLLAKFDWKPEEEERWRWAVKAVDGCKEEIEAAARSAPYDGSIASLPGVNISRADHLRTEAIYYVDRRIAEHFQVNE
ncbi:hypothetical protein [Qipengyuania aquimaris]|uniref:hypothetical protein n=1 Tax=Qipengyuania aquimaris TaxID=255984 RepID=UPI001CD20CDA|nr:hypothetical protein [Qipengyuania aquimaris]MCA0903405.1 hypothetical protein [Qipengyuania aquimaris]